MMGRIAPETPREREIFEIADMLGDAIAPGKAGTLSDKSMADWGGLNLLPAEREAKRIDSMLRNDRKAMSADADRQAALDDKARGEWVNPERLIVPPTPELLRQGDFIPANARRDSYQERITRTVRRENTPRHQKLWTAGIICDRRLIACRFYWMNYEAAGLEGRYTTTNLGAVGGGGPTRLDLLARTEAEAEARAAVAFCRRVIDARHIAIFDSVILDGLSIDAAATVHKCRNRVVKQVVVLASMLLYLTLANEGWLDNAVALASDDDA